MTMPQTVQNDTREMVSRYTAVWNDADADSRLGAVRSLWSPTGTEFVEAIAFRGHDELSARIGRAYEQFVATGDYTATAADDVEEHDDIVTFTVQLTTQEGEVAWAARVFLILDDDGLIQEDYHVTVKPLAA
jgi:hypothetical protein